MTKQELIEKALAGKATEEEYKALLHKLYVVEEQDYDHTDNFFWTESILRDEETGKTYALEWGYDDYGTSFEDSTFYEVEQKEVTTIEYVKKEDK